MSTNKEDYNYPGVRNMFSRMYTEGLSKEEQKKVDDFYGDDLIKSIEEVTDYMKEENEFKDWMRIPQPEDPKKVFEKTSSGALKDTVGKPDITLMPLEILKCFVGPLTYGQLKGYAKDNWQLGIPFTKSLRAALSHLTEWQNGVDLDEEALGKGFEMWHIDAALFHIASIALMTKREKENLDDR